MDDGGDGGSDGGYRGGENGGKQDCEEKMAGRASLNAKGATCKLNVLVRLMVFLWVFLLSDNMSTPSRSPAAATPNSTLSINLLPVLLNHK